MALLPFFPHILLCLHSSFLYSDLCMKRMRKLSSLNFIDMICLIYLTLLSPQIHANCRIRRVYFSDRLYSEDELPAEFKLYLPVQNKPKVRRKTPTNNVICLLNILYSTLFCTLHMFRVRNQSRWYIMICL